MNQERVPVKVVWGKYGGSKGTVAVPAINGKVFVKFDDCPLSNLIDSGVGEWIDIKSLETIPCNKKPKEIELDSKVQIKTGPAKGFHGKVVAKKYPDSSRKAPIFAVETFNNILYTWGAKLGGEYIVKPGHGEWYNAGQLEVL